MPHSRLGCPLSTSEEGAVSMMLSAGAVLGVGPALVGMTARGSWGLTRAGASLTARTAAAVTEVALAAPVAVIRAGTELLSGHPRRQVWSCDGRAHVEVRGLHSPDGPAIMATVTDMVTALQGVHSARIDAITHRMVVAFDPDQLDTQGLVDVVDAAEEAVGIEVVADPPVRPSYPGDARPVTLQAWALAANVAGLSVAVAGQLTRLPSLPGSAAAAVVLVDNQPRLRRLLEDRLGPSVTDLALAVSTAVVHGLTQGTPSLLVEAGQRTQALYAARARRDAFAGCEAELAHPDRPVRGNPLHGGERPVPLPPGPLETYADRAATGSLLTAGGLLAATGNPDLGARVLLIGAPKAARAAREAFCDTLSAGLSRRGMVVMNPAALRHLDRVDTVVVDSRVLHAGQPVVLSATAQVGHWSTEHVWSAAQRLLCAQSALPLPPPRGRTRRRLDLQAVPAATSASVGGSVSGSAGPAKWSLTEDGHQVGEVLVGTELDRYADAVINAIEVAGLRLLLTADPAAPDLAGRADEVLDATGALHAHVRRLQAVGGVVAVVSADEDALAAADFGLGVLPSTGRVPWACDVLCGPGLEQVALLVAAMPIARSVSSRGVTSAMAATFLGGLLTVVGGPGRGSRAVLPVTSAAGAGLLYGTFLGYRVTRRPVSEPVLHTPWHALEVDEVLLRLPPPPSPLRAAASSRSAGLVKVTEVLGLPGHVVAPVAELIRNVGAELADPLTPVLATGAAASAVIGSPVDALLVGGVLAANAVISGTQRMRADRALRGLLLDQQLPARIVDPNSPTGICVVAARALRAGQVISLRAGDVVPADARLLEQTGLEVDEASLTGESVSVGKQTLATPGAELADRACLVYEGTTVVAGTALAVVVAVGGATEAGRALSLAGRAHGPAGMQARLEELTRLGLPITLLGGAAVSGLALLRRQPLSAAIGSGVSVAVAAVPEGLPLVATVAQLGAARRLSARGILVRSARTVEALGRVDTVCFDKTGTLTEGRLRVARVADLHEQWAPGDLQARRVLQAAVRACPRPDVGQVVAHATDRAIIDAATTVQPSLTLDWTELAELPFQSDRGFSAALGRTPDSLRLVVKGAPETLLPRCAHTRDDSGRRRLDTMGRKKAADMVHALASQGLRVLAVARRNVTDVLPDPDGSVAEDLAEDLTLLGFVALADIARPQAEPTITALHAAGLNTVMITGDHPVTARAIARGLGIPSHRVVTGPELGALGEQARTELVTEVNVFARVSPEQKLRIIAALQRAGRVVAMTGDGANDAAAIRLADVGIGMAAHGSVSARTAADLVLTNPDLGLILDALVEGRAMTGRVRDAVAILLGGNAGEVGFTVLGTAIAGRSPIGTRQFLLVNMLTDLLPSMAIALAATPNNPTERQALLSGGAPTLGAALLRDIAIRGVTTGAGALAAWQLGRITGTDRRASTMALGALVGTQLGQTLLIGGRNPLVLATGLGSAAALIGLIQTPVVSQFFGCTPLDPLTWATVALCATAGTALAALAPRLLPDATQTSTPASPAMPRVVRTPQQGHHHRSSSHRV